MNQEEFQVETGLVVMTCPACGVTYAIPATMKNKRLEDHKNWYCPNGHTLHFPGETPKERENRTLRSALQEATSCCEQLREKVRLKDYRARGYKAHVTRLKRREES